MKNIWLKRLNALWLGLGVILFWRGAWVLADHYIFPNKIVISGLISMLIGVTILASEKKLMRSF